MTPAPEHESSAPSLRPNRALLAAIAALAIAGIIVSAVSLERHFAKSASEFCDIGERFNCDIVNRSEYSTVMGIPVAGIGVIGYGLLLMLATVYRSRVDDAGAIARGLWGRISIRFVSDLYRGTRFRNMVHLVFDFFGVHRRDRDPEWNYSDKSVPRGLKPKS